MRFTFEIVMCFGPTSGTKKFVVVALLRVKKRRERYTRREVGKESMDHEETFCRCKLGNEGSTACLALHPLQVLLGALPAAVGACCDVAKFVRDTCSRRSWGLQHCCLDFSSSSFSRMSLILVSSIAYRPSSALY